MGPFSFIGYRLFSVGKAIDVEKVAEPSQEDIDALHDKYMKALVELFEENKLKYGLDESVHLHFIGWYCCKTPKYSDTWKIAVPVTILKFEQCGSLVQKMQTK